MFISIGFNVYLSLEKKDSNTIPNTIAQTTINNNNDNNNSKKENKFSQSVTIENITSNNKVNNTSDNTKNSIAIENTDAGNNNNNNNNTIYNLTTEKEPINALENIDISKFKTFLENYSIGINRITYDKDTLESNTFLLMIAKKYFSSNPSKNLPEKEKVKFAFNVENTNKYIKELVGKDFDDHYISSYTNYIGYSASSNSYLIGKDIDNISNEKYTCKDLKFTDLSNSIYTAEAKIERTIDDEITLYNVTVKFKINENYTYQQFQIIDLIAENKSFYPDNTVHLVD